jgi:hypothetical protein
MFYKEIVLVDEEYHSLAQDPYDKSHKHAFPVFKNPTKDEIKELGQTNNTARFIAHKGDLYAFSPMLLHANAIKHLGLPITSNPPISHAFLGVAKANHDGSLAFKETNQHIPNADDIRKHHSAILHYFK